MIKELTFLHSKLNHEECLRIILLRNDWEITVDKTDILGEFNGMIRIVRASGRLVSINPNAIAVVCTMRKDPKPVIRGVFK